MQTKSMTPQAPKANPLISFIITYYNQPYPMLKECVESILRLSLSDEEKEIIVVDDGSANTVLNDFLSLYQRIKYFRQSNAGVSAARNIGIDICKGKYVHFIDADDYLISPAYEHCLDLLRFRQPDVVSFDKTSNPDDTSEPNDSEPTDGITFLNHQNIKGSICGYIFYKSLLINLKFSENTSYGEDEEFTPQLLLLSERLISTDAKAYFYRQHSDSVIHRKDTKSVLKRLNDNFDVICRLNERTDTLPPRAQQGLKRRVAQLTMDYLYNLIVLTKDAQYLEKAVKKLYDKGLFPLPDKDYTKKYQLFRKAVNSKSGRRVLLMVLPRMKKEE